MLTQRQSDSFKTFSHWLRDEGNLYAKLKGYAGTGKTYLVQHVISEAKKIRVMKYDTELECDVEEPFKICVTAPTHQAKEVVATAARCEARTLQSIIGLAPNTDIENFDINNPAFDIKNTPAMPKYDLVVIDESSMIPTGVMEIVKATAKEHGVKVLFVYDAAQLAPIGEDIIPVDIEEEILISEELTEVIRTSKENPVLETFTKIRNNLFSQTDAFTHEIRISKDKSCGEYYIKNLHDFEVRVVQRFWKLYHEGDITTEKVLAWSNAAVSKWNTLVRNSMRNGMKLEDRMSNYFLANEPLVSYSTIQDSIITNSKQYFLQDPEFIVKEWEYFERDRESKAVLVDKPLCVEIEYIKGRLVTIDGLFGEDVMFVVPEPANYAKFLKAFYWFHSFGTIDRKWPAYYAWKDQNMLLRDVMVNKKNSQKKRLVCKKDFDYSYAVTIHKS